MRHLYPATVFLSAYERGQSAEQNWAAHRNLLARLRGIPKTETVGSYMGVLEMSVAVSMAHLPDTSFWTKLGRELGQEAILVRWPDGSCYLVDCLTGVETYIGQWAEVSERKAKELESFTMCRGKYYACV